MRVKEKGHVTQRTLKWTREGLDLKKVLDILFGWDDGGSQFIMQVISVTWRPVALKESIPGPKLNNDVEF